MLVPFTEVLFLLFVSEVSVFLLFHCVSPTMHKSKIIPTFTYEKEKELEINQPWLIEDQKMDLFLTVITFVALLFAQTT